MFRRIFVLLVLLFLVNTYAEKLRVITLAPSLTETVAYIGAADCLVAVSTHCIYPPSVEFLPHAGGYQGIDYEKIMRLSPDLVLCLPAHKGVDEKLTRMGIKNEVIPQGTIDEIYRSVIRIGRLLNKENQAKDKLLTLRRKVLSQVMEYETDAKVLLVMGHLPGELKDIYVAGPGCFLGQLLSRLGYTNAYAGNIDYPQVSIENIIRMSPDMIILFNEKNDLKSEELCTLVKPWHSLPLKNKFRVEVLNGDYVFIPGPRFIRTMSGISSMLKAEACN